MPGGGRRLRGFAPPQAATRDARPRPEPRPVRRTREVTAAAPNSTGDEPEGNVEVRHAMSSPYSLEDVMEWLDHSQSLLSTVLSFVGEAREPLTPVEVERLRETLILAMDVVIHIVRNAASIEGEGPAREIDPDAAPALPEKVLVRFTDISQTLVRINSSLESRYVRLN